MPRDWDDRAQRAAARHLLSGQNYLQEPIGATQAEPIGSGLSNRAAAKQHLHGPQEDTVTTEATATVESGPSAPTPKRRKPHEARKYRLRTVIIMTFVGMVIGGFAGWGIVYYRDWWFSDELMTTRAFLVPVSIVVGFVLFLILVKIPKVLVRRSRENRELKQELRDLRNEVREWRSGRTEEGSTVVIDDRPPPPLPVRASDSDPALITSRIVPAPRPAPVRGGPARHGALRTTMGDDRPPRVGDTRPATAPIDITSDSSLDGEDDDDLDVPSFLK